MSTAGPSDLFGDTAPDRSEALIEALVEDFHDRLRRGENPDLYSYQQAYPHLAVPLEERLLAVERLHELAADRTGPSPADEPPAEPLPSSLGRYELRRVLGRGATAIVYEAFDTQLRRLVALKVLRTDLTDSPNIATRFTRDARLAARLRHSHIVPMHEAGVADGRPYIDMELVDGLSLEQHLQNRPARPWEARAAAQLVSKIALALAHAHRQGILHRDVKPSNILIDSHGEPQLTDFGLAREVAGATALTAHGDILGTPAYMSPEQASGQAHRADARSDVYSLGVIFYRLLTGQLPFRHVTTFELLACTARSDVPPIRRLNRAVPRDLETICLKALERDADDRFRTAQEFADELWRWLHDEPVRSSRPSLWGRVRRWRRRNRAVATVLTGAAVLLAGVAGSLGWALWWQVQQTGAARLNEAVSHERMEAAQEFGEREASLRAELQIRHLLAKARQRLHQPTKGQRLETQSILRQIKEPRGRLVPGKVRDDLDLEARSLFAATFGVPEVEIVAKAELPENSLRAGQVAIHPDGNSVVLATPAGPVRWTLGETLRLPENIDLRAPLPHLAYNPDGKSLVSAPADGSLQLWDESVTRKLADLAPPQSSPVLGMGFDRAGKTLWTCRANGQVEAWSLPERKPVDGSAWTIPAMTALSAAAFDREATRLAVGDSEGRVFLMRIDGTQPRTMQGASTKINALAWSADGRRVAAGCRTGDVHLWETAGDQLAVMAAFDGEIHSLTFHPEGQWIVAEGISGCRLFDVVTRQLVLKDVENNYALAAAGRRFAGVDREGIIVAEFRPPVGIRRLSGDSFRVDRLAWSRDNRHLVSLDSQFAIRVWDRERGGPVAVFRERPTDFFAMNAAVALSDDGRLLAFASGGESRAVGNIREIATGKVCSSWELPGGFERLTCTGGDNFLLVREELEDKKETTQTVARDLSPGRPISLPRVLRRSETGDVRRFFGHGLSADGRYYWWTGPRLTPWNRRVEIYDVKANIRLLRLSRPTQDKLAEIKALLSPDGRSLWCGDPLGESKCAIAQPESPVAVVLYPLALSPDGLWSVIHQRHREPPLNDCLILGRGWHAEKDWLAVGERGGSIQEPDSTFFSPDSHYLAWGDDQGTIHIADLPFLEEKVRAFAAEILTD